MRVSASASKIVRSIAIKRMLNFLRCRIFTSKHDTYYYLSLMPVVIVLAFGSIIPTMVSMAAIALTGYLYFTGYRIERKKLKEGLEGTPLEEAQQRTINTSGGNYTESVQGNYIQGDYITVQGNTINVNQGVSDIVDEFKKILGQLESKGCSLEAAKQTIINDLAGEISENENVRLKFIKWLDSDDAIQEADSEELAIKFIVRVVNASSKPFDRSAFVDEFKYGTLRKLLKNGKWKEADEETVQVVCKLMPRGRRKHNCTDIEVEQIPQKDLKKINELWLKYSGGRFGFSEQQKIWRKIAEIYQSEELDTHHVHILNLLRRKITRYYQSGDSCYRAFFECVGWAVEQERLYHTDFLYSLHAPRGHLPAKIMLQIPPSSNYSYISECIFEGFMNREYYRTSFIPSWLRAWFIAD